MLCVPAGLTHKEDGESETQDGEGNARIERDRSQAVACRQVAGQKGGERDRNATGKFIQPHGEAALFRSNQVDLHDDGRRPAQTLIDAEEHVREDHPAPTGRENEEKRDR